MTEASIAALARADMEAALTYADCAARHAGAVNAYEAVRKAALDWNETGRTQEH